MAGGGDGADTSMEFTPSWVVALVCTIIVSISLIVERLLHFLGKFLKRKKQKPLYEALLKIKEELMLLGFISLLLIAFDGLILRICVSPDVYKHFLPCRKGDKAAGANAHYQSTVFIGVLGSGRRLLAGAMKDHCTPKGKVPLLSLKALHDLHIFIFVLAISHVTLCVVTMFLGSLRIRQWKIWEDAVQMKTTQTDPGKVTFVGADEFIQMRFRGVGRESTVVAWLHSFGKHLYGSVSKADYTTMRLGFIMTHCPGNPKLNFHKYMLRALEADFKKVVGISWYLWIFVVIFLLLNINGWNTYFWISFIPLVLLLAVGTKLEHVITQLAHEVAEKHAAVEGDLVLNLSDDFFWWHRPKIVLNLIHFILFQNAFEIAIFFWIWITYGFRSCIMGPMHFVAIRIVVNILIQILCSYSTLPLYAIVTQMGSSFKKEIFDENVQQGLVGWAQKIKNRKGMMKVGGSNQKASGHGERSPDVMLQNMGNIEERI